MIHIVSFHRNMGDVSMGSDINPRGRAIKPAHFFRNMIADYSPDKSLKGMSGLLHFKNTGDKEWCRNRLNEDACLPIELEVEYKPGYWYPLKNGMLPSRDPQNIFGILLGSKVHWKDLPLNTHIGWRGPMILLEDIKKMPLVYYT